jgi:hypothetical protein
MPLDDLPIPDDTVDADTPPLHQACLPLRPLLGVWRGAGEVDYPTIDGPYRFAQQLRISHDGRPFLRHEARAWLLDGNGDVLRPAARETGWWRPQSDGSVELLLCHATGILELFYGTLTPTSVDLRTDTVVSSTSAKHVSAAERHYDTGPDHLFFRENRAMVGNPMAPHVSARLLPSSAT